MGKFKSIRLIIKLFYILISIGTLDIFLSVISAIIGFDIRGIQIILRAILITPLFFYILKKTLKKMHLIDWVCLIITELLILYCALTTQTYLTVDYFWATLLVLGIVAITAYPANEPLEKYPILTNKDFNFIISISLLISLVSIASSINFWLLGRYDSINPNAVCAISGLCSIFLSTIIVIFKIHIDAKKIFLLKTCLIVTYFATLLSLSRVSLIWIFISFIIILKNQFLGRNIRRLCNFSLLIFCIFTLIINLITLTGQSEALVDLSQQQDIQWRIKGDTDSDVHRLKYYNVVMQYLADDELLTGAGFGLRGYREYLAPGEDVHNAYLTTLSDSGYIGTYTLLFTFCLWPIFRCLIIKNQKNWQSSIFIAVIFSSATFFPIPVYGSQYISLAIFCFLFLLKKTNTYEAQK
jgi:hypothetical protein